MKNNMENEMETGGIDTGLILDDTYKGRCKTFMRIPKRGCRVICYLGFQGNLENQIENKMENEMETGGIDFGILLWELLPLSAFRSQTVEALLGRNDKAKCEDGLK